MRAVSLAPSNTEVVFALGCGEWLIGRTAFCDYPPEAQRIPAVGGWTTANVETAVALEPDLALTSTFLQDSIALALRERGIPVCHTDPRTLADVLASFQTVATALGVPERGTILRRRYESEFADHVPSPRPYSPRIYAEEWSDPPMGSGNWVPDLIQIAGGVSFLPAGVPSRTVTLDEVRAFDPDVIVLNYCGMDRVNTGAQRSLFTARHGWYSLRAVQAGRVFVFPDSLLNRPGPRLVEGVRLLQHAVGRSFGAAAP